MQPTLPVCPESDVDLVRRAARALRDYPSRECDAVSAEFARRGRERIRAAARAVAIEADAQDRSSLESGDVTWMEPFCACGRRLSHCDGSRRGCREGAR
ncbi:hypothetical protein [Myxococcus sp. CA040A]|uniref:hypothetical protein n=1 Tax=Myxococcus sp. CA040A TaxID=2741738 RepID=UPI00157B86F0|nr:hypothetical protein [Myxococcus sp. CA040A]NTX08956.1 hypothetical protein [Myxococcus sp. CA040A]